MTQKRAWTLGTSAAAVLVSLGIMGFGCAGGGEEGNSSGVPCIPEPEACDNFDNDCDGQIDEDCDCKPGDTLACYTGPENTRGKGACVDGAQTCSDKGKWGACENQALPAADDACDGIDNNCDGMTDEACECSPPTPETTQPCYTGPEGTEGIGECLAGAQSCAQDGTWDTKCKSEVKPKPEACDNLDNDCNGEIDDMGMTTCGVGACQVTVVACTDGAPTPCTALTPTKEVCDGVDNDCDQLTDENDPDNGKPCDSGLQGLCSAGQIQCQGGVKKCVPATASTPEKCDGLDNDCDGVVDDNVPGTGSECSSGYPGLCSAGQVQCINNVIDCFPVIQPASEVCDGLDNDCDDLTDEENPGGGGACDTGSPGICAPGTLNCISGAIQCTANALAQAEKCDGIDNNCDGAIDENNVGGGAVCTTGLQGACSAGVKNCINGSIQCTPNIAPVPEKCDGIDNNCNGLVDDANPEGGAACSTGLQGVCAAGTITCLNGALSCKQNNPSGPEICGNGLDDNCDGQPDPNVVVYFSEDFANNSKGWTLGTQWAIGPTAASSGHSYGNADPAQDHTSTADNGVAGVVLGGNASTAVHAAYYLTSPVIDLSAVSGPAYFEFFRWLNSDYASYMVNTVDVFNGTTWVNLFTSGGSPGVQDNAWKKFSYDVTMQKSATFQVRFGFSVGSGAYTVSQWNVDDVAITSAQCF